MQQHGHPTIREELARDLLKAGTSTGHIMPRPLPHPTTGLLLALLACDTGFDDPSRALGPAVDAPADGVTEIHEPATLGRVDTPAEDVHGAPVGVACATCHAPGADGTALVEGGGPPDAMHASIEVAHGDLSCNACHDADDRTSLHLADGTTLPMARAMDLCAQCHGPQYRDYSRGSHGGMRGSWDLRRGDRERNHCLDCHGAHDPSYPELMPVLPPQDRGTVQLRAAKTHAEAH